MKTTLTFSPHAALYVIRRVLLAIRHQGYGISTFDSTWEVETLSCDAYEGCPVIEISQRTYMPTAELLSALVMTRVVKVLSATWYEKSTNNLTEISVKNGVGQLILTDPEVAGLVGRWLELGESDARFP